MKIRTISIVLASLALAACAARGVTPSASGVCEALRPSFPIGYHGGYRGVGGDSADTIARIRTANARFVAACR
jgi:hypothetical protein